MKIQFQQFLKGLTIFGALYSLFENYQFTKEKQTYKSKYQTAYSHGTNTNKYAPQRRF